MLSDRRPAAVYARRKTIGEKKQTFFSTIRGRGGRGDKKQSMSSFLGVFQLHAPLFAASDVSDVIKSRAKRVAGSSSVSFRSTKHFGNSPDQEARSSEPFSKHVRGERYQYPGQGLICPMQLGVMHKEALPAPFPPSFLSQWRGPTWLQVHQQKCGIIRTGWEGRPARPARELDLHQKAPRRSVIPKQSRLGVDPAGACYASTPPCREIIIPDLNP